MTEKLGFLKYKRREPQKVTVKKRIKEFHEFEIPLNSEQLAAQAARCMSCGIPFCHSYGCPVGNRIPEWIEMVARGQWKKALAVLHSTDNFPEITGRVCPAPCEAACTLNIDGEPVTIKHIELQIIERGFSEGWIVPQPATYSTGKNIAVIGSGPAGLAAAQQLARTGHQVTVFEKEDSIGGLMRYGIPDFKLEKSVLDRRLKQMRAEGIIFETSANVGIDILPSYLLRRFDAILIAIGASVPRDIDIPGRDLDGIAQAVPYLTQQNRRVAGHEIIPEEEIFAKGKHVLVIGGGDTGSDCVGTANRQGARSVTQVEILPTPPEDRSMDNPWPTWPRILNTSSSHEEGCRRIWSVAAKEFIGIKSQVRKVSFDKVGWKSGKKRSAPDFKKIPNSGFTIKANLVLLAMGFIHAGNGPILEDLGLKKDDYGNIRTDNSHMTNIPGVFSAGDAVTGASLIVTAIQNGRKAAAAIDSFVGGKD